MGFYDVWPMFACLGLLYALAATPLLRPLDRAAAGNAHLSQIDGLRGFLALAVFFHHASLYHEFDADGQWLVPPYRFYANLGPLAVSVFFMITGFLFWRKLIDEGGRPNWFGLYVGRFARIGPLYLAALLVMLVCVAFSTRHLAVTRRELAQELAQWVQLGFGDRPDINGYSRTYTLEAGVTWTLRCEWLFYLALLPLCLAVRRRTLAWPLTLTAFAGCLAWIAVDPVFEFPPAPMGLMAQFGAGMSCAVLDRSGRLPRVDDAVATVFVLLAAGAALASPDIYQCGPTLLLAAAFALIVSGTTLGGVLTGRPARRLGDISFGLYLLQGFALGAVFAVIPRWVKGTPEGFWCCVAAAGVLLIVLASVAHVLIERPGVALGRAVGRPRGRLGSG